MLLSFICVKPYSPYFVLFQCNIILYNFTQKLLMESNIPRTALQKPKFEWNKINSQFRLNQGSKSTKMSLKPTLKINHDSQLSKIQTKIHIDTQKSLQYENEIGWNWHKSSNLPIISIKLEIRDLQKDVLLLPPTSLEARIFATKFVVNSFQKDQVAYLQDVGIRGPNNIQLRQGCGFFNGVRFSSTSYNNQGVKFYLVIVIYQKNQNSQMQQNILCSLLSPPIFVDSRKSARDYQQKRFLSFVELFHPSEFQKLFKKRQTRNNANDLQTQIANNFDGLYNYLTAPNIRHKVKHPLFLSVKFSNVFKIFYNKNHESFQQKKITAIQVIKKLQKKLVKQVGGQKKLKKSDDVNKKLFIISMVANCNESKKAKIMNVLEYLDSKSIFIAQFQYMITESFVNIDTIDEIIDAYVQIYPTLQVMSEKQISARRARQIEYQRSQKDAVISQKQEAQDKFVKRQYQQYGSFKSQRYDPNPSRNQNESEKDNLSDDANTKERRNLKKTESNQLKSYMQDDLQIRQSNFTNGKVINSLLQNNLNNLSNSLNDSPKLINPIQDVGCNSNLQSPLIKQGSNHGISVFGQNITNLSNLPNLSQYSYSNNSSQSVFASNLGMNNNFNSSLQSYFQYQLSRTRNSQNRHFILKDLLNQVISKSSMLNKMLYENQMLKNKILIEMNHSNHIIHQMNLMASLKNDIIMHSNSHFNPQNNFHCNPNLYSHNNYIQNQLRQDSVLAQNIFDNNGIMANFKQTPSQQKEIFQRHHENKKKEFMGYQKGVQGQNFIAINNSCSLSSDLQNPQENFLNNQLYAQKYDKNWQFHQIKDSMEDFQCKFQENVFNFNQ